MTPLHRADDAPDRPYAVLLSTLSVAAAAGCLFVLVTAILLLTDPGTGRSTDRISFATAPRVESARAQPGRASGTATAGTAVPDVAGAGEKSAERIGPRAARPQVVNRPQPVTRTRQQAGQAGQQQVGRDRSAPAARVARSEPVRARSTPERSKPAARPKPATHPKPTARPKPTRPKPATRPEPATPPKPATQPKPAAPPKPATQPKPAPAPAPAPRPAAKPTAEPKPAPPTSRPEPTAPRPDRSDRAERRRAAAELWERIIRAITRRR